MNRTIYCHYLKKEAPGLNFQLYPGELGKRIFNEISQEAWNEWLKKQTMLINENKYNMMDATHRKQIESEMIKFLFSGEEVTIKGYVPEKESS